MIFNRNAERAGIGAGNLVVTHGQRAADEGHHARGQLLLALLLARDGQRLGDLLDWSLVVTTLGRASATFRLLAEELVTLLAYEATDGLRVQPVEITTPVATTMGVEMSFIARLLGRSTEQWEYVDSAQAFMTLQVCPVGLKRSPPPPATIADALAAAHATVG